MESVKKRQNQQRKLKLILAQDFNKYKDIHIVFNFQKVNRQVD